MTRPKAATLRQGHGTTVPEFRVNPEPVVAPDPPNTLDAYGNRLWHKAAPSNQPEIATSLGAEAIKQIARHRSTRVRTRS